jgi:pimeloyl-ACP methyl ester carboxylesterase
VAVLTLPDRRLLAYQVMGNPAGLPVLVLHGTPGSARQLASLGEPASQRGVALIVPDRPGYGRSSYDPAGTIASAASDLGELMRQAGLDGCPVVGLSGGGPTALACGVVLVGQVSAVCTVGSPAPMVPRDPRLPPDRLMMRAARRSKTAAQVLMSAVILAGRRRPEQAADRFAGLLAEPDARLLREPGPVRAAFLDDIRHPSATAARAAARDFWLFARPWQVDLAAMRVPAHVWHGSEDRNVPVAHARVIADRCPAARLHIVDGGGHMLLGQLDQIMAGLLPGTG